MRRSYSLHSSLILLNKGCLNDNRLFPLYGCAQELGIPIMFYTGSSVFPNALLKYGDPSTIDETKIQILRLNAARILRIDA